MLRRKPYFASITIKRYLLQILALFSGYQCRTGLQRDNRHHFIDVPCIYGDSSRVAAYIISGSENSLGSIPVISCYMTGLENAPEWKKTIQHTEKQIITERATDPDGNLLVGIPGKKKVIEKYMPNPFMMTFDVAVWCSNNNQLYELTEMLLAEYMPEVEIQISNSPADWTSLTWVFYEGIKFEKAVPEGENPDPLYVATLSFKTPIWIGPPVKKYDLQDIRKIVVDFKQLEDHINVESMPDLDQLIILPTEQQLELHDELEV